MNLLIYTDNLQLFSVSLIFIVFLFGLISLNSNRTFLKSFSSNTSNYLTTLGIFFTFLGIFIGLQTFDTSNINSSIPSLLDGLKLAFISSIVGIFSSILFRIITPIIKKRDTYSQNYGEEIVNQLVDLNKGTSTLKDAISGEGDSSLSTQLVKLRTDFRDFAEKVAEEGSQSLIKALENVISDFNAKINEQFGENFKQLNEAVTSLLDWQKEYKEQLEKMINIFQETQKGIDDVRKSIELIEGSSQKIPEQITKLEVAFDSTDKSMKELYSGLETLANLRNKAEDSLPFIEKQIINMTENFESSVNNQVTSVTDMLKKQADTSNEVYERFRGVGESLNLASDSVLESVQKSSSAIKDEISNFQSSQTKFNSDFQDQLNTAVNDLQQLLNQSITGLDSSMQQSLQRSLDILGNNLTAITQRFVDTYEPFANRIQDIMNRTNSENRL